jgi:hypothetical protein
VLAEPNPVETENHLYTLGILGLINGLFGVDERGWGHIASVVDDGDNSKIIRFIVRADEPKEDKT